MIELYYFKIWKSLGEGWMGKDRSTRKKKAEIIHNLFDVPYILAYKLDFWE